MQIYEVELNNRSYRDTSWAKLLQFSKKSGHCYPQLSFIPKGTKYMVNKSVTNVHVTHQERAMEGERRRSYSFSLSQPQSLEMESRRRAKDDQSMIEDKASMVSYRVFVSAG
jgi:hypothetical protein